MQNEQTDEREPYPEELIAAFSRAKNYPRELAGIQALAQGLRRASTETGIEMRRIVDACLELSRYCPTDSELLGVARNMAEPAKVAEAERKHREWEAQQRAECGPPKPFVLDWDMESVRQHKAREATMYRAIRAKLGLDPLGRFRDGKPVNWQQMANAARELGYTDYADAWEGSLVRGAR